MPPSLAHLWRRSAGILVVGAFMAGCSRAEAPAPPAGAATLPPPDALSAPTASPPPSPWPTYTPGGAQEPAPAPNPASLPDVPYDMTGYEIIAANVGSAVYSGYSCVWSPVGCACELPLLLEATFTFTPEGRLHYFFKGDDFQALWEMERAAPNQWLYKTDIQSEEQDNRKIGEGLTLLSFTQDGYVITQMVDLYEQGIVTCPDVTFQRLMGTPAP